MYEGISPVTSELELLSVLLGHEGNLVGGQGLGQL